PLEVVGTGIQGDAHQGVFVGGRGVDAEHPLALEEEGHVPRAAHLAAAAFEDFADFAGGAVAVVGEHVHQDGHAARAVAFVGDLPEGHAFAFAGAAFDGPFDVFLGHADLPRLVDGVAQLQIHFRVAAAVTGGDDDGPAELAKELTPLGVDGPL